MSNKSDSDVRLNEWQRFEYRSAEQVLRDFRTVEHQIAGMHGDPKVRSLRTGKLRKWNERRQAALFCHAIGVAVLGVPLDFAMQEAADHDCVARWKIGDEVHYAPIQLKEWTPSSVNPQQDLEKIFAGLKKYSGAGDLIVGIYGDREAGLYLQKIKAPPLAIGEIWIYGSTSADASTWFLYGNLLKGPIGFSFRYPT